MAADTADSPSKAHLADNEREQLAANNRDYEPLKHEPGRFPPTSPALRWAFLLCLH
jgi:hypothetical protein